MLHPLEVGALLSLAGYADHVVAAGLLHDVLENTDTDAQEDAASMFVVTTSMVRPSSSVGLNSTTSVPA